MTHTHTSSPEEHFGAQVREAREKRDWSQEALARRLREHAGVDLHQTAIARLERGERTIRLNEAAALAKLLSLDLQVYSGATPQLTDEDYETTRQAVREMAAEEHGAQLGLAQMRNRWRDEEARIEQEIASSRSIRLRLEAALREYERRTNG